MSLLPLSDRVSKVLIGRWYRMSSIFWVWLCNLLNNNIYHEKINLFVSHWQTLNWYISRPLSSTIKNMQGCSWETKRLAGFSGGASKKMLRVHLILTCFIEWLPTKNPNGDHNQQPHLATTLNIKLNMYNEYGRLPSLLLNCGTLYLNILSQPRPCQLLKRHLRLTFFVATSVMSNVTFVV